MLGPDNTMNGLGGRVSYGTAGKTSLLLLGCAFVALGQTALNQLHLTIVAGGAALDERHICIETHPIYVVSRRAIVQRTEHHIKLLEEINAVVSAAKQTDK